MVLGKGSSDGVREGEQTAALTPIILGVRSQGQVPGHWSLLTLNNQHSSLLSYTVLQSTVLYSPILLSTVLHCSVMFCSVLLCLVLYCSVLFCTVHRCSEVQCEIE